jgi:hypothetical protein
MAKGSQRGPAQRRLAEVQARQHRQQLRVRSLLGAAVVAVAVVAAVLILAFRPGATQATGTPQAKAVHGAATGQTVDGIQCSTSEQTAYHIHAHLAIYDNGAAQQVPAGIGIPGPQQVQNGFVLGGKCLYWLHTHDATGIIHIESPVTRVYTLGDFFDIWGRPLSSTRVGAARGSVTTFVDGKPFTGNPRDIKLDPHTVIQLDVGTVVPPKPYTFPAGL